MCHWSTCSFCVETCFFVLMIECLCSQSHGAVVLHELCDPAQLDPNGTNSGVVTDFVRRFGARISHGRSTAEAWRMVKMAMRRRRPVSHSFYAAMYEALASALTARFSNLWLFAVALTRSLLDCLCSTNAIQLGERRPHQSKVCCSCVCVWQGQNMDQTWHSKRSRGSSLANRTLTKQDPEEALAIQRNICEGDAQL